MNEDRKLSTTDLVAAAERADVHGDVVRERRPDERDARDAPDKLDGREPLFVAADAEGYRTRWGAIQTGFVDEPRKAVEEADALVAEVVKRLAEGFAETRQRLEADWERNDQVSTEDLRQSMRRYRSFFDRLLNL
jgi:hypothetical protein